MADAGAAEPVVGGAQRHASLQQSGPLDDDGHSGGAEYLARRPLRSVAGQYRRGIPRRGAGRGGVGRERGRGRTAGAAADQELMEVDRYTGSRLAVRSSSTVEQRAVNATVPGSNPGSGANPR